ncbi:MAG: hypothetical protein KC464_06040, partial [Myxococcales bacterium]|nr:hypothetical protein [Myxococcales bacterium]
PHARVTRAGVAWHHRGRARRDRHQRGERIEGRGEGLPPMQSFLLPPSPREWLPASHLVYFVEGFVARLNDTLL